MNGALAGETATTSQRPEATQGVSWPFAFLCCVPLLLARLQILSYPLQLTDFICYWASSYLYTHGGHPYSIAGQFFIQKQLGWPLNHPFPMLCPPWSLPFVGISGLLPFQTARILWFACCLLLNCLAALLLWIHFGGERRKAWIALLAAFTFLPMAWADYYCQVTPFMLVGLALVLQSLRTNRPWLAGASLLLLGFKPHLLYLFFFALLLWIVKQRQWRILAASVLAYSASTATAWTFNHSALDYLQSSTGTVMNIDCGIGGALRSVFGPQHTWLQVLPCFFGAVWFVWYWRKHQSRWDWSRHVLPLLAVSVATAPYYWAHDFILIFPAIIYLAVHGAWRRFYVILGYFVVQLLIYGALHLAEPWLSAMSLLWIPFVILAIQDQRDLKDGFELPSTLESRPT